MDVLGKLFNILDAEMDCPEPYGWFHLMFFAAAIFAGILLCVFLKKGTERRVRRVILSVAVAVILLEIYKQINFSFTYNGESFSFDYQWYAFPWQFCSMPMFVGLLAGLTKKGKLHDAMCAFLATYAVVAGVCVMFYPNTVFMDTIGINIQTMVCHGSMITVGIYLLYTGYVKIEHKTILKAIPVFCISVLVAVILNEIAYRVGILETEDFNMFFISPYCEPSLPVYSSVQKAVDYPWCLMIYMVAFTAASYLVLLVSMLIKYPTGFILAKKTENKMIYHVTYDVADYLAAAAEDTKNKKRKKHKKTFLAILIGLLGTSIVFGINAYVKGVGKEWLISSEEASELTNVDCILVLGCLVKDNGTPSDMLADRLTGGIELYESGAAPKLLMSGDHGRKDYNEVAVMKQYAIDAGIASDDIFMDHAGFSTYESLYRAKEIFGADKIIIVTQEYHLFRALYIAEKLGIEAYGVASDYNAYAGQANRECREILARVKDFAITIFKPKPTYLGEAISVSGNGDVTND